MGIVRRQSIYNAALIYLGVAIGFCNKVVIFQYYLTQAEYGMLGLIASAMVLGSELSQFGAARLVYRFFPHFKRDPAREGAFAMFVLLYVLAGYVLALLLLLPIRGHLVGFFADNSPLFTSQFWLLLPAILAHTFYRVSEAMARSHLRSVVPTLTWEVLVRLWQTVVVLLYAFDWLTFDAFAAGYVLSFFVPGVIIIAYLIYQKKLRLSLDFSVLRRRAIRVLVRFSLMTSLSYVAYFVVLRVDVFMVGGLLNEAAAGAYDFAFYLVYMMLTPTKSISSITLPLLSDHLKHRRMAAIQDLHHRSSTTGLILAQLLFLLMYINLDAFFQVFPKFSEAQSVIILLGLGNLSTVLVMSMRWLIINSRHYRFDLISSLLFMAVVVGGNFWLIPLMGIDGAALATAISLLLYNASGAIYVRHYFGLSALNRAKWLALALLGLCLLLGLNLPTLPNPWADMVLRSAIMLPVYVGAVLALRLSPDLNDTAWLALRKLGWKVNP